MKGFFRSIAALLLVLCIAVLCMPSTAFADSAFFSSAKTLKIKSHIESDAGYSKYATAQGSCTDGKYAYFAVSNGSTALLKYDINTWKLKKKIKGVNIGHANDMAYNPNTKQIVVAHNRPDYDTLSFINPKTLKVTGSCTIDLDIYSIAYSKKHNCYVVGISGTYDFALLDNSFNLIKKFKGRNTGYVRQGADCDDDYIYFIQSSGGSNLIVVYDYYGNLVKTISLKKSLEGENIFHKGNTFYVTLHYYGNYVYRIGLSDKTDIKFTVHFDSNEASGEMKNISVKYGKKKTLPECKFEKDGYFFGGWMVYRESTKKWYGKTATGEKSGWYSKDNINEYSLYGDKTKLSKTASVGNVTLKAFWIAEEYKIQYDCGDDALGTMPTKNVAYDEQLSLEKNSFIKNGYVFNGWRAQRDYDDKYYAYAKGKDAPCWLDESDVERYYHFTDGETVSKLTFSGSVTMSAQWISAFTFDSSSSILLQYSGDDNKVTVPENSGMTKYIHKKAFYGASQMQTLILPKTIQSIDDNAFSDCTALGEMVFTEELPIKISPTAFDKGSNPVCYLQRNNERIFLGWYTDRYSLSVMRSIAQRLE